MFFSQFPQKDKVEKSDIPMGAAAGGMECLD